MWIQPDNRQRGIALIVVMLVIVVLGLLAAGLAYSMKVEMRLAQNAESESELLWLGRSGVELACWYLAEKGKDPTQAAFDALNQRWAGGPVGTNEPLSGLSLESTELGRGKLSVRILDLERRFNINLARRDTLEKAMELLGYDLLSAATVVDSIEDWRDPDDAVHTHGAESDTYLKMARPYFAKDGPIDDLSELLLVQGVTPELLWGDRPTGSRRAVAAPNWTGRRQGFGRDEPPPMGVGLAGLFNTFGMMQVNINTASTEVLQMLPLMDENLAREIVRYRAGPDGVEGTEDDTPFLNVGELINVGGMPPQYVSGLGRICGVRSHTFEIRVRVRVDDYERTYVAIVRRAGPATVGAMPILTAYWAWD
jgi:type II secretory pathway component PulK